MKKPDYAKQLIVWRKRRERAQAMHAQGFSLAQIGEKIGCTKQRVHQLLRQP